MEDSRSLSCPHCPGAMREVETRARSGYVVLLDQCPTCGGIWCDRWELFPITSDEALRIDPVDPEKLRGPAPPPGEPGRCPRCGIGLRPFLDPSLPPDARIERCRVCEGMWLNRGELGRWKGRYPRAAASPDEALERLVASYGAEAKWPAVANLDRALDTDAGEDPLGAAEVRGALGAAVAWVILRLLVRLLLRI